MPLFLLLFLIPALGLPALQQITGQTEELARSVNRAATAAVLTWAVLFVGGKVI